MMFLYRDAITQLLCASGGEDSQVSSLSDLLQPTGEVQPSWRAFGLTDAPPLVTVRSSLRTVVFEVTGTWSALESVGVQSLFALAIVQVRQGSVVANVGPASVEYLEVHVNGDEYEGRIDLQLLGDMRVFQAGELV